MMAAVKNKKLPFEAAFARLKTVCERKKIRLTPLRAAVWECLWRANAPVGAYDLIDDLKRAARPAPPVSVYRVLDFWIKNGVVHRLERENAYVLCAFPDEKHTPVLAVCSVCGRLEEFKSEKVAKEIKKSVKKFKIKEVSVRVDGICADCRH